MRERTAGLIASPLLALVRALLPARGRHRAAMHQPPATETPLTSSPVSARPAAVWPFVWDTHLVRPYLLTPEERRERRADALVVPA
ncbi:hypothetical protein ACH41H_41505 [Streptomyces sp. NPDC020800]|uniref:hypothetical protein n=1 Tax=Streptomyces sp. NPDC020800 TaxID=3365092 RepID=UPI0037A71186